MRSCLAAKRWLEAGTWPTRQKASTKPEPIKKIIGDLSNEERVLVGLDVQPPIKD